MAKIIKLNVYEKTVYAVQVEDNLYIDELGVKHLSPSPENCKNTRNVPPALRTALEHLAKNHTARKKVEGKRAKLLKEISQQLNELEKDECAIMKELRDASIKLTKVKKMVIQRLDSLKWVNYHTGFPQNLVLDVDCFVDPADLIDMAKLKTYDYYVHTFEVRSPDYVTIDGVVYTQNRKKAVTCDADMENLVILDGVEEIIPFAFSGGQKLKTVRLPDSLEKIGMNAFELCRQLHRIDLGEGVTIIPDSCFERCTKLKTITLPPQIKEIRREAFWLSGLEVINLNEGLERVHDNAFVGTCIESIKIPKTVQDFPKNAISHSKNI